MYCPPKLPQIWFSTPALNYQVQYISSHEIKPLYFYLATDIPQWGTTPHGLWFQPCLCYCLWSIIHPNQFHPTIICTNRKWKGYVYTCCISPGGGVAGKTIEESKQAHCHDHCDPSNTKQEVSVKVQGADGHAYFMSIDAQHLMVSKDETANKICWHHGTGDSIQYHSLHHYS